MELGLKYCYNVPCHTVTVASQRYILDSLVYIAMAHLNIDYYISRLRFHFMAIFSVSKLEMNGEL